MRPFSLLILTVCLALSSSFVSAGSPPAECDGGTCAVAPRRQVVHHAAPRRVVVHQHNDITVVNGSAQSDAEVMASTGVLRHQGHNSGCREGIGFSTASADDAIRRCCFYGRYRTREVGVARGSRGWFACIRYE
jgi:hypothetical protein